MNATLSIAGIVCLVFFALACVLSYRDERRAARSDNRSQRLRQLDCKGWGRGW